MEEDVILGAMESAMHHDGGKGTADANADRKPLQGDARRHQHDCYDMGVVEEGDRGAGGAAAPAAERDPQAALACEEVETSRLVRDEMDAMA